MKVTTERLPKSLVALDIELDSQQVNKGLDQAARKLSQQYRIPGFRPGKAPRFIVENYLGRERILEEASDDLMNAALKDAFKSENLAPVGQVKLESFEAEPFHFRVTVPVEPTVELAPYTDFRLPLEREAVSDESVQKLLDAQREQHVVLQPLEMPRPAQLGDLVTVKMTSDLDDEDDDELDDDEDDEDDDELDEDEDDDDDDDDDSDKVTDDASEYAGDDVAPAVAGSDDASEYVGDEDDEDKDEDEDDEADEGGETTDIVLEEGRTRPEFLSTLIGANVGEIREIDVTYTDDEPNERLQGKTVHYTLEIEKLQARLLPEWDELPTLVEFDGDLAGLRQKSRDRLEHAADERARRTLLDQFVERTVGESQVDLPDAMIDERAAELFHEQVAQFTRYGLTEDQLLQSMGKTHEEAVADYHEQAERDVRVQQVLRTIIQREGLTLGSDDLRAETERFLEDYDSARRDDLRPMLESERMQQMIASTALDRKLRDRIVQIAISEGGNQGSGIRDQASADADQNSGDAVEQTPDDLVGVELPASAPVAQAVVEASEGMTDAAPDEQAVNAPASAQTPEAALVLEASEGVVGEDEQPMQALDTSETSTSGV